MKNPPHATTGPPSGVLPRITGLIKSMAGILMAVLFINTGEVRGQSAQNTHEVKLVWNASTSKDVSGYRIHYGTASRTYTASIVLGNVTSANVPGLAEGVTYHFTVSAISAAGLESGFSNEASFKTGLHTSDIGIAANGQTVLSLRGLIGIQYDIEASVDLNSWTLIAIVTIPQGGSLKFSDPDAGSYPKRFYRTRQRLTISG